MSEQSFNKLVGLLSSKLQIDERQPVRPASGSKPIAPQMAAAGGMRFMGGECAKSVAGILGISKHAGTSIVSSMQPAAALSWASAALICTRPAPPSSCPSAAAHPWPPQNSMFHIPQLRRRLHVNASSTGLARAGGGARQAVRRVRDRDTQAGPGRSEASDTDWSRLGSGPECCR